MDVVVVALAVVMSDVAVAAGHIAAAVAARACVRGVAGDVDVASGAAIAEFVVVGL